MPAPAHRFGRPDPRERLLAIAGVLLVQLGLGLVLFRGLEVHGITTPDQVVSRLIRLTLPPPPPPVVPPKPIQRAKVVPKGEAAAPAPRIPNPGGSPGPAPHGNAILPKIAVPAPAAADTAGGGRGAGASIGSGSGGGSGDSGDGEGGTDLEKITGDIYNSDYPPNLARAGIGGRVTATIEVGTSGRVTGCRVTRSSGNSELDSLTCRLIQQRYRFRPSTDRYGRPVADEADVDQDWIPPR